MTGEPPDGENPVVPFLLAGPQPDRTRAEGWQQWRAARGTFIPAPRLPVAEYQALSLRGRAQERPAPGSVQAAPPRRRQPRARATALRQPARPAALRTWSPRS